MRRSRGVVVTDEQERRSRCGGEQESKMAKGKTKGNGEVGAGSAQIVNNEAKHQAVLAAM